MAPFLSETEMGRVGLMMGQACFARTDRMDIKSETKLMLIEVMAAGWVLSQLSKKG